MDLLRHLSPQIILYTQISVSHLEGRKHFLRFIDRRVMLLFRFIDKHAVSRCVVSVLVDGIFTWFMGLVVMLTTDTLSLFCGKVRYVLRVKFKMNTE